MAAEHQAVIEEVREAELDECINCGDRPGDPFPTVCPNCGFRDIEPCPNCRSEVPRQRYENLAGALFRCPDCLTRVRMDFNSRLFDSAGQLCSPTVLLRRADE